MGYIKSDGLYDLLGTAYLREHQYAKAAAVLKNISAKRLATFPQDYDDGTLGADPFISQMPDYPKIQLGDKSKPYTKLMFARAMAALQNQIKAEPKNAVPYFKYATALYNTAMHGNAWCLISYDWSAYDYGRKPKYYYDADYVQSSNAEVYFLKARQLSNSREFKTKCTFMAAKCQQKQIHYPQYGDVPYERYDTSMKRYNKQVRRNPYFAELRNAYRNTAYYRQAVNECSYLKDFIAAR